MAPPLLALALAGCAMAPVAPPAAPVIPEQWQAPLPTERTTAALAHQGSVSQLSEWWARLDDPVLLELIMAAEAASPSLATARANIAQARASRVLAGAALLPTLTAATSLDRSQPVPVNRVSPPLASTAQARLDATWELDLFGKLAASRDAEQQRLEGSRALWHAARVSVAAEVANQYFSLRACEKLLDVARADAASRGETARLSALSTRAGFQAPATDALARASAADGRSNATAQRALCDLDIKALVALSALAEPDLRRKLAQSAADNPREFMLAVTRVPAEALAQRPDVFNAAREVDAARQDAGAARAQRYPRLTLGGSIATTKVFSRGTTQRLDTWTLGPLQLSLPLFDGGASRANVEAADARYVNAAAQYRGLVRQSVREVEEALVQLQSTGERHDDALAAAEGYRASFTGTQARYQGGLASLVELEDARRTLLAAQGNVVNLERGRRSAWVALYKALGGGWRSDSATP